MNSPASSSTIITTWLTILLDASVKAAVLLSLAAVLTAALRRGSAALRHMIWTLAAAFALCLPILSSVLPAWPVWRVSWPAVPAATAGQTRAQPPNLPATTAAADTAIAFTPASRVPDESGPPEATAIPAEVAPAPAKDVRPAWARTAFAAFPAAILLLWAVGGLASLMPVLLGMLSLRRITKQSRPASDGPWTDLLRQACGQLSLRRPVRLFLSQQQMVPVVSGWLRPTLLLPESAQQWSVERARIVLLHELAHVRRGDCITQTVGYVASALYWFNPLAWLAARHLRAEQERAGDDVVLSTGCKASAYAGHLVEIARTLKRPRFACAAAVAMARPSGLEARVQSLLDAHRNRRGLTRRTLLVGVVVVGGATALLASLRVASSHSSMAPEDARRQVQRERERRAYAARAMSRTKYECAGACDAPSCRTECAACTTVRFLMEGLADSEPVWLRSSPWPLGAKSRSSVAIESSRALARIGQPAVAPLILALRHGDREVKPWAAEALGEMNEPRAVPALIEALHTTDRELGLDLRHAAVTALAQVNDPRAVDALIAALTHEDTTLRSVAASEMGNMWHRGIRDARVVEPLIAALDADDTRLRSHAAFTLGIIGDRRAFDPLIPLLEAEDRLERESVAFALGELRDPRALDPLIDLLEDEAPRVRTHAAAALWKITGQRFGEDPAAWRSWRRRSSPS